jgi:hypothetical protein
VAQRASHLYSLQRGPVIGEQRIASHILDGSTGVACYAVQRGVLDRLEDRQIARPEVPFNRLCGLLPRCLSGSQGLDTLFRLPAFL